MIVFYLCVNFQSMFTRSVNLYRDICRKTVLLARMAHSKRHDDIIIVFIIYCVKII